MRISDLLNELGLDRKRINKRRWEVRSIDGVLLLTWVRKLGNVGVFYVDGKHFIIQHHLHAVLLKLVEELSKTMKSDSELHQDVKEALEAALSPLTA